MRAPTLSTILVFGLGLGLAVPACGGGGEGDDTGDDTPVPRATWYQDVGPIVQNHCAGCHQAGGIAPFALTAYDDAAEIAPQLLDAIETGLMPPWDAEDAADCTPSRGWKDDPRLSPAEIETFRVWIEDGSAAGTVADLPEPAETELTGITHSVVTPEPFVTSGDTDQFMCFLLQPQFTQNIKWMTGLQVVPGNPDVVHHAVLAQLNPGPELDALRAEHGDGKAFQCTSPATAEGAYLLGVWTPGNQPVQTSEDLSVPMLRGGAIVMQIHYHPANQVNAPDATRIDLRLSDTWPTKMYTYGAFGNAFAAPTLLPDPDDRAGPEFRIPANSANHGEHMRFTFADTLGEFPLFAAYPHMHYIGVGLKVKVERAHPLPGEEANECLVNVPKWNFDWQRSYQYQSTIEELPVLRGGDTLDVQCTYDNTLENPFVQRALADAGLTQPINVLLGEQTLDEMCLGIFGIVLDAPAQQKPGSSGSPRDQVMPSIPQLPAAMTQALRID